MASGVAWFYLAAGFIPARFRRASPAAKRCRRRDAGFGDDQDWRRASSVRCLAGRACGDLVAVSRRSSRWRFRARSAALASGPIQVLDLGRTVAFSSPKTWPWHEVARKIALNARKRRANAPICTVLVRRGGRDEKGCETRRIVGKWGPTGDGGGDIIPSRTTGIARRCVCGPLRFASRLSWVNRGAAPERRMA